MTNLSYACDIAAIGWKSVIHRFKNIGIELYIFIF